jgi:hypothetical protein
MIIDIIGSFPNPWKGRLTLEKSKYLANKWNPSIDDFLAALDKGRTGIVASNFSQFLGSIQKQKENSIERINFISHAGEGLFAFTGIISGTDGRVSLTQKGALDQKTITDTEPISLGGGVYQESLGAIAVKLRNRFTKEAKIFFYLCQSGAFNESGLLLQDIANAFQVKTCGFTSKIIWCANWKQNAVERGLTGLGPYDVSPSTICGGGSIKRGLAHLVPNRVKNPK